MGVSGVTSVASTTGTGSTALGTTSATPANSLSGVNFLTLLTAQLENQDPLDPVDDNEFTTELAQLSEVDSVNQLTTSFSQMLSLQQLTQGSSLIGKTVGYTLNNSSTVQQGVVSAVNVANGSLQLTIGGNTVPLSQVTSVTQ
jgi:flagellar basal-body rod modification protein FlgD